MCPKKASSMLCWIVRSRAIRALPLYSPPVRLHLKRCCPVLVPKCQKGVEVASVSSGGGWGLEHTALEEKLRHQGLFRSEAGGSGDLNADPPEWEVTEKTGCCPRHM